jgi:hypothetical protein
MANFLNVRRVLIQEIDEAGRPVGKPDYGVLASDNYEQGFTCGYRNLEDLNAAIDNAGNILDLVGGFDLLSREGIGFANYAGKPWCAAEDEGQETRDAW